MNQLEYSYFHNKKNEVLHAEITQLGTEGNSKIPENVCKIVYIHVQCIHACMGVCICVCM
jgi:hypothetical protein